MNRTEPDCERIQKTNDKIGVNTLKVFDFPDNAFDNLSLYNPRFYKYFFI